MARNVTLLYDGHDYYKRMFELQEKLRKSEEERIRLEERFNVLVRESGNRHDACINRLRMRYIHYLEEQRIRDERNHKLLAALDRVMSKLALISAKKDRLNVLRKQYEAYLLRVYANRQPPGSVTGDSGIASQHEDKRPRKTVVTETRNVLSPRTLPMASSQSSQPPRSSTFATRFHDRVSLDDVPPIHQPISPTASSGAARGVDRHHQASILHASPIGQSGDQFVHWAPASLDTCRSPRMSSVFEGDAPPSDSRNVSSRIPHATASAMPMAEQADQSGIVHPVNRFFREHVESMQAASGPSTARVPADDATRHVESEFVPSQFDLPTSFRYYDTNNALLSDPQSRMRVYDDATTLIRPSSVIAKSSSYRMGPDASADQQLGSLPGYMDYTLTSPRKSEDGGSVRSLTSDDVDDLIKRNERLLWENADVARTRRSSIMLGVSDADFDENSRATAGRRLENELDRYIGNIRKLHQEHGVQSWEELDHEQNTSGDLLNVSLSEDALELPAEDRKDKKNRVPEEMNKVLALADDLVSDEVMNPQKAARPAEQIDGNVSSMVVEDEIRRRDLEEISVKDDVREINDIANAESKRSRGDVKVAKERSDDSIELRDHEISAAKKGDTGEKTVSSSSEKSRIDDNRGNAPSEKRLDVVAGEESDVENLFDVAEQLAPWDLASLQKQVVELRLDGSTRDGEQKPAEATNPSDEVANKASDSSNYIEQSNAANGKMKEHPPQDTLPRSEAETRDPSESHEKSQTSAHIEEAEDVSSTVSDHPESNEPIKTAASVDVPQILQTGEFSEPDKEEFSEPDKKRDSDETAEPRMDERIVEQDNEYNTQQGYVEDPSQAQQYLQQDEQYNYEQTMEYQGGTGNENYESYADQGYAQEGQEYVEYVDGQYEQYPNSQQYQQDPNAQYEEDPNQAYAYNYDPNQEYDPNQQYDPNQAYGEDPNQGYDYTEQVYDPNQTYDTNAYEQGYQEEGRENNSGVAKETPEEKPETQETLQIPQVDSQTQEHKDGDEPQESNVADQSKKKKKKDVIKSLLDSDTDTTIEKNVSNTESDFDFN